MRHDPSCSWLALIKRRRCSIQACVMCGGARCIRFLLLSCVSSKLSACCDQSGPESCLMRKGVSAGQQQAHKGVTTTGESPPNHCTQRQKTLDTHQ